MGFSSGYAGRVAGRNADWAAAFEVSRLQEVITSRISRGLPANSGKRRKRLPFYFPHRSCRLKNMRPTRRKYLFPRIASGYLFGAAIIYFISSGELNRSTTITQRITKASRSRVQTPLSVGISPRNLRGVSRETSKENAHNCTTVTR